jgi:hypothetical protein
MILLEIAGGVVDTVDLHQSNATEMISTLRKDGSRYSSYSANEIMLFVYKELKGGNRS